MLLNVDFCSLFCCRCLFKEQNTDLFVRVLAESKGAMLYLEETTVDVASSFAP